MSISVFDIFKIGIGPSSSHTVGPMRAALMFGTRLREAGLLAQVARVRGELYGSLGATGRGHGTDQAVLLGLEGEAPDLVDPALTDSRVEVIRRERSLRLLGGQPIAFNEADDLVLHRRQSLPYHPNGMQLAAYDASGQQLLSKTYYSVGGGFVVSDIEAAAGGVEPAPVLLAHPFQSAGDLLRICQQQQISVSALMQANELTWRSASELEAGLLRIWSVMQACVERGYRQEGVLPGGMKVRRRAAELFRTLSASPQAGMRDPLVTLDWINLYALAVNEENAAGGRVVTAPTNGAAGIIPAVLHYYRDFVPGASSEGVCRFLLTAAAIAILFKKNASISGAEVGCQGEVGVACSMAAGALTEVLGGSPQQVENAAEIGMEHNLGLTCDPIGGLVQVPCIERNAMGAIKAVNAARLALRGDGRHFVSLDKVIRTMRETGRDMQDKYKETSRGGLAVNVIEC